MEEPPPVQGPIRLHLHTLDGSQHSVQAEARQRVGEVKGRIARQLGLPGNLQLLAGTEALEDWRPLGSYGAERLAGHFTVVRLTEEPGRHLRTLDETELHAFLAEESPLKGYVATEQWCAFVRAVRDAMESRRRWWRPCWRHRWPCLGYVLLAALDYACVRVGCMIACVYGSSRGCQYIQEVCPSADELDEEVRLVCCLAEEHFKGMNVSFRHRPSCRHYLGHFQVRVPARLEVESWSPSTSLA